MGVNSIWQTKSTYINNYHRSKCLLMCESLTYIRYFFQVPVDGDMLQLLYVRQPRRAAHATDLQHARQHRAIQKTAIGEIT